MPRDEFTTVEDIDEALGHTVKVGPRERLWWEWVDHLLDDRLELTHANGSHPTDRALPPPAPSHHVEDHRATDPIARPHSTRS